MCCRSEHSLWFLVEILVLTNLLLSNLSFCIFHIFLSLIYILIMARKIICLNFQADIVWTCVSKKWCFSLLLTECLPSFKRVLLGIQRWWWRQSLPLGSFWSNRKNKSQKVSWPSEAVCVGSLFLDNMGLEHKIIAITFIVPAKYQTPSSHCW